MTTLSAAMETLSETARHLRGLDFVVECSTGTGFEPIAAFNVKSVAEKYIEDCEAAPGRSYSKYMLRDLTFKKKES